MATLKDVVGKLEENNQKLGNIDTSIDKVEAGILGLFGLQKRAQLDQLEAAREAGQSATNVATLGNEPKGKGAGGDPDNDGGGLLSGLAGLGTGLFSGLSLASILRGSFKKLPFLAMTLFGDEFAEHLKSAGFEAELADSFGQAIQAAGIAGIISPRLAPLAGILGLIIDEETANELKAIKDDFVKNFDIEGFKNSLNTALLPLQQMFDELGFDFDLTIDSIPSFKEVLDWMRKNLIEGVQGLSNILLGEGSLKDLGSAAGVLGAIAFAFAPFRTIALASKIPGVAFLLGKKLLGAVKTLGSLALGLNAAAAAAPAATATTAATAAKAAAPSAAFKAGRLTAGLLAFATGPVGLAILGIGTVAGLGMYITEATKDIPFIKEMKKRSESIRRKLEAQPGMDMLDEGGMLDVNPANQTLASPETDTARLAYLKGQLARPDLQAGTKAVLENQLKALQIKMGLEKAATSNSLTDLLSDQNRRQQGQITAPVVDQSVTNVGSATTAFIGSGTSSVDIHNPNAMRAMMAQGVV